VELLGEYKDSGYSQPPRGCGGPTAPPTRPSSLSWSAPTSAGSLTAGQVRCLIAAKLLPLGIVADPGAPAAPPTANPLLALRARGTLLPERAANAAGALLRPLFRWPVVVAVAAAVLATDWWLVAAHGLGTGLRQHLMTAAVDAVGAAVVTLSPGRVALLGDRAGPAGPPSRACAGPPAVPPAVPPAASWPPWCMTVLAAFWTMQGLLRAW